MDWFPCRFISPNRRAQRSSASVSYLTPSLSLSLSLPLFRAREPRFLAGPFDQPAGTAGWLQPPHVRPAVCDCRLSQPPRSGGCLRACHCRAVLISALPKHPLPLVGKKLPAAGDTGVIWGHDYDEKRWNILKALDASDPAKAKTYPAVTTTNPNVNSCSRGCYCQKGCCWWHIPPKWLVVRTL